jgi:uncharacterized protein (DUF1684 family)
VSALTLVDYRRRVARQYGEAAHGAGSPHALERFRSARAELFASHPDSPLVDGHEPPAYWPHDPALRFEADVDPDVEPAALAIPRSDGSTADTFTRIGRVHLPVGDLDLWWLEAYGGGLFLPFRDATNGDTSYGGGRYLLDTVKGADLGSTATMVVVDFNYAYHPSCFYSPRWACPLAPAGNVLPGRVEAGERLPTSA